MILGSMISFLFGAALAQRFNVLVLVPAMAFVMVVSVGAGITHLQVAWEIVKMAAIAAICLQCGYFAGILIRHFLSAGSRSSVAGAEPSPHHAAR